MCLHSRGCVLQVHGEAFEQFRAIPTLKCMYNATVVGSATIVNNSLIVCAAPGPMLSHAGD